MNRDAVEPAGEGRRAVVPPGEGSTPLASRKGGFLARLAPALLLAGIVTALFLPAVRHPFFSMDDGEYVLKNPVVSRGVTVPGISWAITSVGYAANWHPLTWVSHMLDVSLFGLQPAGHHLMSVLIHALATAVLWAAIRALTGSSGGSTALALLFAIHPQRVESVAWIAERKDLLCGLFIFLTLRAYAASFRRPGWKRYGLVLLWSAAAMAAKPMAVTLPALLLLLDIWPLGRLRSGRRGGPRTAAHPREGLVGCVREKLPLFAIALATAVLTWRAQGAKGAIVGTVMIGPGDRVAAALTSTALYLRDFLWPADLALNYAHPLAGYAAGKVLPHALALVLLTAVLWTVRRRGWPLVGWCWFLGALLPVIGLVQVGAQARADRYMYVPSVGLSLIAVWCTLRPGGRPRRGAPVLWLVIALALALTTAKQLRLWQVPSAILARTVAADPDNLLAHLALGEEYRRSGRDEQALGQYREALRILPVVREAHAGTGEILMRRGGFQEAAGHFAAVVAGAPDDAAARFNLGVALDRLGDREAAVREYRVAIQLDPSKAGHWGNLGLALDALGRDAEARETYRRALALFPASAELRNNWGVFLMQRGDTAGAATAFREALRIDPGHRRAADNLSALGRAGGGER